MASVHQERAMLHSHLEVIQNKEARDEYRNFRPLNHFQPGGSRLQFCSKSIVQNKFIHLHVESLVNFSVFTL
jgi:hypothetical protein